jgi:hypothetical protein
MRVPIILLIVILVLDTISHDDKCCYFRTLITEES